MLLEIWSGGQTGVDRAALDVAIELGLPYGGWIPAGRMAEDGPLDGRYRGMTETSSPKPDVRTRRNVRDTDATLIIAPGELTGGTLLTQRTADQLGKPFLVIDLESGDTQAAAARVSTWLGTLARPLCLNVAGPRASTWPDGYSAAIAMLREVLSGD